MGKKKRCNYKETKRKNFSLPEKQYTLEKE